MVYRMVALIGLVAAGLLIPGACGTAVPAGDRQATPQAHPSPAPTPENTPGAAEAQSLRSIDFRNFTYPYPKSVGEIDLEDTFTLHDGTIEPHRNEAGIVDDEGVDFGSVSYDDVTGDKSEEAVVVLTVFTGGSAVYHRVYIYSFGEGRPKVLWAFETGDRADGGLYSVYADDGNLVVELNGKNRIIGKNLYGDDGEISATCCPKVFTRTRYKWDGKHFKRIGKAEVLNLPKDGDSGSGSN